MTKRDASGEVDLEAHGPRLYAARQEDLLGDHEALDLGGALVDLEELRVAHQLLDRVLLHVAVAAEDLDRVGRHLHRRVGGEALRERRVQRRALAAVDQPRRLPREQPRGLDLGRHVGDQEVHALVHRDRHVEGDALLRVLDRELVRGLRDADGAGRRARPREVERLHRDLEAVALLAEPVLGGHDDVLQRERRRVGRALAHLVEVLLDRHARRVHRDDERGHAAVALRRVGLREDDRPRRPAGVRDERLRAVEDVLVAAPLGRRLHARDVGARVRLATARTSRGSAPRAAAAATAPSARRCRR